MAVFESVLRKAVIDVCPQMMVGEHVGDTFIWARTDATCWVSTEQVADFKEEGGGEALGI